LYGSKRDGLAMSQPPLLISERFGKHAFARQWTRGIWVLGTMALVSGMALLLAWKAYQPRVEAAFFLKQSNAFALKVEQIKTQTAHLLYSQLRMVDDFRMRGKQVLETSSFSMGQLQGASKALRLDVDDVNKLLSSSFWTHDTDPSQQAANMARLQAAASDLAQKLRAFELLNQDLIGHLRDKTLPLPAQQAEFDVMLLRTGSALDESAKSLALLAKKQSEKVLEQTNLQEDWLLIGIMTFSALAFLWNGALLYFLSKSHKQNQALHREMSDLASLDPLTGLLNRRALKQQLSSLNNPKPTKKDQRAPPSGDTCLMLIDLDFFKQYNDTFGHVRGDAHLKACAAIWRNGIRGKDVLARMGGEEFAVLMPNCNEAQAFKTAQRLQQAMPKGTAFSAGIALMREGEAFDDWYQRADAALYAAKANGRGQAKLAGELPASVKP
jgi:diguanylate cyclase (GGDEF)-like protein